MRWLIDKLLQHSNRFFSDGNMSDYFMFIDQSTLKPLSAKLANNDSFEGICAVRSNVHGYEFYFELIELKDGSFLNFSENDFDGASSYLSSRHDISLRDGLKKLRQQYGSLKGKTVPEIDPTGRYATMYFVFRDDVDLLVLHRPLTNTKLRGTTLERIYFAVAS